MHHSIAVVFCATDESQESGQNISGVGWGRGAVAQGLRTSPVSPVSQPAGCGAVFAGIWVSGFFAGLVGGVVMG